MPEWLMGTDCKSVDCEVYAGSNPARPKFIQFKSLLNSVGRVAPW